jgi:hypothetical protein
LGISTFTATVKGAVPPPTTVAGKFLKDDGTWSAVAGAANVITAPFSATPVIDAAALGPNGVWRMTLTGNVTSSTIINAVDGQMITIQLTQDIIGYWTFAWPSNVFSGELSVRNVGVTTAQLVYYAGSTNQWYPDNQPHRLPDAMFGEITVSAKGATVVVNPDAITTPKIADTAVTNAKLANMPTRTLKGNNLGGSGAPLDLTATQATALLDVFTAPAKGLVPAPTTSTGKFLKDDGTWASPGGITDGDKGDITVSGSGSTMTIDPSAVTNAKQADMLQFTMKGRKSVGTGPPEDLSVSDVSGMMIGFMARIYGAPVSTPGLTHVATHNLGRTAVMVEVFRNSAPFDTVDCDVERTSPNTVTLRFATAVSANQYYLMVHG